MPFSRKNHPERIARSVYLRIQDQSALARMDERHNEKDEQFIEITIAVLITALQRYSQRTEKSTELRQILLPFSNNDRIKLKEDVRFNETGKATALLAELFDQDLGVVIHTVSSYTNVTVDQVYNLFVKVAIYTMEEVGSRLSESTSAGDINAMLREEKIVLAKGFRVQLLDKLSNSHRNAMSSDYITIRKHLPGDAIIRPGKNWFQRLLTK